MPFAQSLQELFGLVSESLAFAATMGFVSLALPAIGTGNLQYPRDVVAETMYKAVIDYSEQNPDT